MSDDDKIDFGALDPARDGARWQAQIAQVVERALARRRARSVPMQLVAWRRPTLAAAAFLAVAVWAAILLWQRPERSDPADRLGAWAVNDEVPAPARILELFGDDHGTQ